MPFFQSLSRLVRRRRRREPTCDSPPSPPSVITECPSNSEHASSTSPPAAPPELDLGCFSSTKRRRLRKLGPTVSPARTTVPNATTRSSSDLEKPLPELPYSISTQLDQFSSQPMRRASSTKRKPVPHAEKLEAAPPVPLSSRLVGLERASDATDPSSNSTAPHNSTHAASFSRATRCAPGAVSPLSEASPSRTAGLSKLAAPATIAHAGHPQTHIVQPEEDLPAHAHVRNANSRHVDIGDPGFSATLPPPPPQPEPNPLAVPTPRATGESVSADEGAAPAQHSLLDLSEYLGRLLESPELSQVMQQAAFREHVKGCMRDGLFDEGLTGRVRAAFAERGYPLADENKTVRGVFSDEWPSTDEDEAPRDPEDSEDAETESRHSIPAASQYASREPDPFVGQSSPNIPSAEQRQTGIRPEAQLPPGHALFHGSKIYVLQGLISVGIKDATYTATDEVGDQVAVRVIAVANARSMVNEYQVTKLAAERDEPFIVRLLASWMDRSFVYFVTHQYTSNAQMLPTLLIVDAAGVPRPFDLYRGAAELISGLASLHRMGFVHRLLTAENILVTPSGRLALANFSGARRTDAHGHVPAGPPAPRVREPPECAFPGLFGARETQAADVWRLGWLLAELFARVPQQPYGTLAPHVTARWHAGADVVLTPEAMAAQLEDATRLVTIQHDPLDLGSLPNIKAMDPHLFDLLSKMLVRDPRERWTAEQLKTHPYFSRVDWNKLEKCGASYTADETYPNEMRGAPPAMDSDDECAPLDFTFTLPTDLLDRGVERHYGAQFARARMQSRHGDAHAQHTGPHEHHHMDPTTNNYDLNDLNDSMRPRRT
ncbi:kinase-like protein [Phanerochaete sordida]|uniref:non-specific serine/threonine protein kinase n=1 Tax=Phanerochaete sordida TaxID=48140 RepID=A0A9P3LB53_9APHY|nr:kinase-like protein [Phanerochaete sordida]